MDISMKSTIKIVVNVRCDSSLLLLGDRLPIYFLTKRLM